MKRYKVYASDARWARLLLVPRDKQESPMYDYSRVSRQRAAEILLQGRYKLVARRP